MGMMDMFGKFKKKPKEASMAEAMEAANHARRKIEKRREDIQKLRGVPLLEIESYFNAQRHITTDYDGNTLVVHHEPFVTRIEVVAPSLALERENVAALIQMTTLVGRPFDAFVTDEASINALNANASGGALIRAKDGRILIGSRFTWFKDDNAWREEIMPLIIEATINAPRAIILSEKCKRDHMPPSVSGLTTWTERDFAAVREALPTSLRCTVDDMGIYAELSVLGGKTALVRLDKGPVNPYLGPGLQARINLPNRFETPEECLAMANLLNRRELSAVTAAWHYGAWYARENNRLSYICFFPNNMWDNPGIINRWPELMQSRVDWVARELLV